MTVAQLTPDDTVVDLVGVDAGMAYAWGVEAGSLMAGTLEQLVGWHIVYAGNAGMVEMIAAERGCAVEVLSQRGDRLEIRIVRS